MAARPTFPRFEELRRLLPALVLSAVAHVTLLQALPHSAKPYDSPPGEEPSLTVLLELSARTAPDHVRELKPAGRAASDRHAKQAAPELGSGSARNAATPSGRLPQMSAALRSESALDPPARPAPDVKETSALSSYLALDTHKDRSAAEAEHLLQEALPLLDYYYTSKEVDQPAQALGDGLLEYPRDALKLRMSGRVKLRLFIDEFGTLVRSEVVEAEPAGIFEQAAQEAVHTMQFGPARKGEQPVRSQRTVEITFDPDPAALRQATDRR